MQVKICGLTKEEEATYLNDVGADYAGFVFYPKSKRNISFAQAKAIREQLNPQIQAVAVTVSPDRNMIQEIINSGFDVIQAHGELTKEALEAASIPVWYAINIIKEEELLEKVKAFMGMPQDLQEKVEAIVVDGASYGGGKAFDWKQADVKNAAAELLMHRKFVLAGGLNESNVQEGMKLFSPDVVDVSSGVEGENGKDKTKINNFARKVRDYE